MVIKINFGEKYIERIINKIIEDNIKLNDLTTKQSNV